MIGQVIHPGKEKPTGRGSLRGILLLTTMLTGTFALYGGGAYAGCVNTSGSAYECSGTETTTQSISPVDNATVTTVPGFSVNTSAGDALYITGNGALSYTDENASSVTTDAGLDGLFINALGDDGATPGSVTVETDGAIAGGDDGIDARNAGSGALTVTTYGDATGTAEDGIDADNSVAGTDLSITTGAGTTTTGGDDGIHAVNSGTGALTITANGNATGTTSDGIAGTNFGTDLSIITGAGTTTTGGDDGIHAFNAPGASGALTITANGDVTGTTDDGIYASNQGADLNITTGAGTTVTGGSRGIRVGTTGTGASTFTINGDVIGRTNDGILASHGGTGTQTVTIGATSTVTSESASANDYAITFLSGAATVNVAGTLNANSAGGGAIRFASAVDSRLELQPGFSITGHVLARGGNDILAFGGTGTDSFDLDTIETGIGTQQYRGFDTFQVEGGTWTFSGTTTADFAVDGGILGGTGSFGDVTLNSGGTIVPGNSIGTLNVTNITINPGSTYEVEVNSAGASDLIDATGTATINGGAVEVLPFPDFAVDTPYTIVTAAGGLTGAFDSTTLGAGGSLFITPTLTYDANNAYVTLAQTADFGDVAMTPNQIATAGGVQSLGGGTLFSAVASLDDAGEARAAFDALSGEIHASAQTALLEDSRFAREAALDRLRSALGGVGVGAARMEQETGQNATLWGQGFGSWSHWNGDGNAAAMDRNIGGFLMGGDGEVLDNVHLGALAGYSRSALSVGDRASSGTVDSYTLGAYGGGKWDAFSLKGGAAYSWHSLETSRSVEFTGFSDGLSAIYNARTLQAYTEAVYSFEVGNARFEPYANLAYVNLGTDGFTETGGDAGLTAAGSNATAVFTTLGLRGGTPLDLGGMDANFSGGLGWRHAFGDTPASTHSFASGGDAFTISGVPLARDVLVLDAGIDVNVTESAIFGLSYSGQLGSGVSDHGAKASLNVSF